jgi:hypothetical protein
VEVGCVEVCVCGCLCVWRFVLSVWDEVCDLQIDEDSLIP